MKKLLTGVATLIALASAVPVYASDITADRHASSRNLQTTASAQGGATSRDAGPVAEPKKPACPCACTKAG